MLEPDDAGPWAHVDAVPDAVVLPTSAEAAVEVMRLARANQWALAAAGAGSWVALGAVARRPLVVLSSARLSGVVDYQPADLTGSVLAGTSLSALAAATGANRQWLPSDAPSAPEGTVGAAFATDCAGPLRQLYGTPRDWVLGLEVITGDGRVLRLGRRVMKNVAGYDMPRLLVGSRGSLGFIARVDLRLQPLPEADLTVAFAAAEPAPLLTLSRQLLSLPVAPAAVEVLSPPLAAASGEAGDGWACLARFMGPSAAASEAAQLSRHHAASLGREAAVAGGVWDRVATAMAAAAVEIRLAGRTSDLAHTLAAALALLPQNHRPKVAIHTGLGIVRALLAADEFDAVGPELLARSIALQRSRLEARRGTLVVETGRSGPIPGVRWRGAGGAARRLERELRRVFDPSGTLVSPFEDL